MSSIFKAIDNIGITEYYIRKYGENYMLRFTFDNPKSYALDFIKEYYKAAFSKEMPNYSVEVGKVLTDENKVYIELWFRIWLKQI